jgi:uncharacterized membrane protein
MKKTTIFLFYTLVLLIASAMLTSCEVIGDIFGAGVYTGIFIVIFVIVLIIFLVVKMMRRK